jgi:hypothetical protein
MPIPTKETSKLIVALQGARNELEQAGDLEGSQSLTSAISCVLMASEDAIQPAPTDDELTSLKRAFYTAPDLRTRSAAGQALIVKEARIAAYGRRPLRKVKGK